MSDKADYRTPAVQSAPEVPASISATALELARALRWLPEDHGELLREMYRLDRAEQKGWYVTLRALCATAPVPGYLRVASDLWKLAGAHSERVWNDHNAAVMACFQFAEIDGERYLYHPRLLRVIAEQLQKLHKRQTKSTASTGPPFSTGGAQLPLHLFSVLQGKEKHEGKTASRSVGESQHERSLEQISERLRRVRNQRNRAE